MQTFLPFPSFVQSAWVLDRQRLGKQRVEVLQILRALRGDSDGWANHPAVRMWWGHEGSLATYGVAVCDEWTYRGYKDTCRDKILDLVSGLRLELADDPPGWLGNDEFHLSHQSNLVRKNPGYYRRFFPSVPSDLSYVWPR